LREQFFVFLYYLELTALGVLALGVLTTIALWIRYQIGRFLDERRWRRIWDYQTTITLNPVKTVTIQPLYEWVTTTPQLYGDAGASYLVEVDGQKILFDLGDQRGWKKPSVLFKNIKALGFDPAKLLAELKAVVISHGHREHAGGRTWGRNKRAPFNLIPHEVPIYEAKKARPADEKYTEILPGVALSEPLPGRVFLGGQVLERMLIINLEGKGLVCVAGDAHPEVLRMVHYASKVCGAPPYAFVGGIHALLEKELPLRHRILYSKRQPWRLTQPEEIGLVAVGLQEKGIKKVLLSAHDSDATSLGIFGTVFGEDMDILRVGTTYKL